MKKLLLVIPLILAVFTACAGSTYTINVNVPAGTLVYPELSYAPYSYSDEEICPTDDTITITLNSPAPDMMVTLVPVKTEDRLKTNKTQYITPGLPVEFDVEEGVWYKVGLIANNNSNADILYPLEIKNVEVRIEEKAAG